VKNNQIFLCVACALIAALMVSCSGSSKGVATSGGSASITFPTPGVATTEPAPTAPPAVSSSTAVTAIVNASKAQLAAKSWRVKSNIESNGVSILGTLDYAAPDRYHLTTSTIEMISIGSKSYMKQNGTWVETPLNVTSLIGSLMNSALPQELQNNITGAKLIGPDTLNGKPMSVYQFNNTMTANNINIATTTKLWVGESDGLPYQEVIQGNLNGIKTTTTNLVEYDPKIQIQDPTAK
jgi:hypothetical protein